MTSDIGFYYEDFVYAASNVFTVAHGFTNGSELVFKNGMVMERNVDYTVTGVDEITISNTLTVGDMIGIYYIQVATSGGIKTQNVTASIDYLSGMIITLDYDATSVNDIQIWYNGINSRYLSSANDWTYIDSTHIKILSPVYTGDQLYVRYSTYATSQWMNYEILKSGLSSNVFYLPFVAESGSAKFFVNGLQESSSLFNLALNGLTVTIDPTFFATLSGTDVILMQYSRTTSNLARIRNTSAGKPATEYVQGINFMLDYTTGEVLWIPTATIPAPGDSYEIYYTYFPKDIIDNMIGILKPATEIVEQRYFTTDGVEFNPFNSTDWPTKLPQEDLIF